MYARVASTTSTTSRRGSGVGFRVRERPQGWGQLAAKRSETTQLLGDECLLRPPRWRRMEPISYRATPAFYPHTEQFIIFAPDERDLLLMLQEGNESELASFASGRFGLGATPPTDAEILEMLRKAGSLQKSHSTNALSACAARCQVPHQWLTTSPPIYVRWLMIGKPLPDSFQASMRLLRGLWGRSIDVPNLAADTTHWSLPSSMRLFDDPSSAN